MASLSEAAPSAMIFPLHEHPFNRCKSNIAWLEATFAGAACIAPDWAEWRHPGVLNYTDEHSFSDQMNSVMRGDVDVEDLARTSWAYIQDNLTLEKVNKLRWQVVTSLL